MADTDPLWVENTGSVAYQLDIIPTGKYKPTFSKVFKPHVVSSAGKVMSNGFTYLTGAEIDKLVLGTRYSEYLADGLFVAYEELPETALTDEERYADLLIEVASLRTQVAGIPAIEAKIIGKNSVIDAQATYITDLKAQVVELLGEPVTADPVIPEDPDPARPVEGE